jgi:hypothetical protein
MFRALPTDEGFIHFDFATCSAQFDESARLHCRSDAVKHEPSRFLSDSKRAPNLATRNAIATVDDHPERSHPLIHPERGILKDRPDFDGELLIASTAEPQTSRLDEVVAVRGAAWADDLAIGPPELHGVVEGALRIGEVNDGFLQGAW